MSDDPLLAPGARVGPYEIAGPLGSGGMGDVYKATDTRLGRVVALKFVRRAHADRLGREAQAIAALNHPHICTLFDAGPDYLVMEFVDGAPLRGPLPVDVVIRYARQMASALQAAHARGIVHRDLKPANILVTSSGVKLLDFGLARMIRDSSGEAATTSATMEGTVLGTAAYMSPEQAAGQPADARSDLFSLGAVLYEAIGGRRAFGGETMAETMGAVLHDEPRRLDVTPDVWAVVARCLRKAPAERYQSAADLLAALDRIEGRDVPAGAGGDPSIAVLPFANMSDDKDNEYFSDGLAEEILNALARVPRLKVTARTSSFAFRGTQQDVRAIGETLDVRTVLEGSVRRAGSRIRVTAQLIDAVGGYHLWSERYDRELTDVFAVQDEIAAAIAGALRMKLAPASRADERYRPSLPAYEAFLQGRHFLLELGDRLPAAIEAFKHAVALDPGYPDPHVELASCYVLLWYFGLRSSEEAAPLVRAEVQRAVELGTVTPRGQGLSAIVSAGYDYDWEHAGRLFERGLSDGRGTDAEMRWCYATFCLAPAGRFAEAIALIGESLRDDPLNDVWRTSIAHLHGLAGHHAQVIEETRQILAHDRSQWIARLYQAEACWATGQMSESLSLLEAGHALVPWHARTTGLLAALLEISGKRARAAELVRELASRPDAPGFATGLLLHALVTGDVDRAAEWWGRAIDRRDLWVVFNARSWITRSLRASPHWAGLAARMRLPIAG
jgi:serine/threonine-protein kinase